MLVKVPTLIYLEVEDVNEAEEAAGAIESGLAPRMEGFPHGEVVSVEVDRERGCEAVSEEEANEKGLVE